MVCLIHNLKYQIFFQHLSQCSCKCHLFLSIQWNCLYPYNTVLLFHHIFVIHNHSKTHTSLSYSVLVLTVRINLKKISFINIVIIPFYKIFFKVRNIFNPFRSHFQPIQATYSTLPIHIIFLHQNI